MNLRYIVDDGVEAGDVNFIDTGSYIFNGLSGSLQGGHTWK